MAGLWLAGDISGSGLVQAAAGTDYAQVLLASMRAVGVNVSDFGERNATQSLPGVLG